MRILGQFIGITVVNVHGKRGLLYMIKDIITYRRGRNAHGGEAWIPSQKSLFRDGAKLGRKIEILIGIFATGASSAGAGRLIVYFVAEG